MALTSLGAVGGARGTAAGALRIFVEFLTTYDKKAIGQLETDLRNIDHAQNTSARAEEKRQRKLHQVQSSLTESERVVKSKLNTQLRADLKRIEGLEASRSKINRERGRQERTVFNQLAKNAGVSREELENLGKRDKLKRQEVVLNQRQAVAEQGQLRRAKERHQVEGAISKVQAGRAALGPRLAGLAIGAVGGVVGGAILGVGFQLAQAALEKIGDVILDIVDPARHAKEAISNLGQAVIDLAKNEGLTIFDAAKQKAEELGLAADEATEALLRQFAAQQFGKQATDDFVEFVTASIHANVLATQSIKDRTEALIKQAKAEGTLTFTPITATIGGKGKSATLIDGQNALTLATEQYNASIANNTRLTDENARAKERLAQASALARFQQDALNSALQRQAGIGISAINTQIAALSDVGPSAKTLALESALEKAQSGGSGSGAQLRNIAEQRQLILLRQRLRLLGQNIDLEKFSGKFLLEAINAKIRALQKEGDEQSRLNQLLDLQYESSRKIQRQTGESISDFLERRAKEQRSQLQAEADFRRQAAIDELSELQEKVSDEVALAELAEQRRDALRQGGVSAHIKALQKQLEASKKADAKALEAQRKALEAKAQALQDAADEAGRLAEESATQQVLAFVKGARNLDQLIAVEGRVAGLVRARATIQALLDAFAIPPAIGKVFLENITKQLNAIGGAGEAFRRTQLNRGGGSSTSFAHGGVIQLNNARSPFGSNVRFGEEGEELGVILSNRVTKQLKESQAGIGQVGPFYLQGSGDQWRDKYAFKRMVKEAVQEALN